MFKRILSLVLVVVMSLSACLVFGSCQNNDADDDLIESPLPAPELKKDFEIPKDFKVGFVFLHDDKSTYDKNFMDAAKEVQEILGLSNDQVLFKYPVNEEEECPVAVEYLVNQGCDVIFADSFGHENGVLEIAAKYPNVQFCHATGTQAHTSELTNVHNAFASIYEGRYLAGIAAGLKLNEMIQNGEITAEEAVIGYVGAFPYAEVKSGYTSFYLGAKSVCPSVTMKVNFTNSWYSVDAERQNALALINAGCKLISQHADSMGAPSACEERGVPNVSYNGSTYAECPETFIVSSRINWAPYFMYMIKSVVEGTEIATDWCGGIEEGSIVLSDINGKVAAEGTKEKIEEAITQLKAGTLHVFDTSKFTVNGQTLTSYLADVDTDDAYTPDTEVIEGGYFHESEKRSAPYFDINIDGITILDNVQ